MWDSLHSFEEEKLKSLFETESFQTERYKKCMGKHWNDLPKFIEKLHEYDIKKIQSIIKEVNEESIKYYSGFACELCHPRAVDGTDIETDKQTGKRKIVRVRHEWPSVY